MLRITRDCIAFIVKREAQVCNSVVLTDISSDFVLRHLECYG